MSDFKSRLEVEKNELEDKTRKLTDFLYCDKGFELSEGNRLLLNKQLKLMNEYLEILIIRLELLN